MGTGMGTGPSSPRHTVACTGCGGHQGTAGGHQLGPGTGTGTQTGEWGRDWSRDWDWEPELGTGNGEPGNGGTRAGDWELEQGSGTGGGTRDGDQGLGLGTRNQNRDPGQGTGNGGLGMGTGAGDRDPGWGPGTETGIRNWGWDWEQGLGWGPGLGSGTGTGIGNRDWDREPGLGTRTRTGDQDRDWDREPGLGLGTGIGNGGCGLGPGTGTGTRTGDRDREPRLGSGTGMGTGTWDGVRDRDQEPGLGSGTGAGIGNRGQDRGPGPGPGLGLGLGLGTGAGIRDRGWDREPGLGTGAGDRDRELGTGDRDRGPGTGIGNRVPAPLGRPAAAHRSSPLRPGPGSDPGPVPVPLGASPSPLSAVSSPPPFGASRPLQAPVAGRFRHGPAAIRAPPGPAPPVPARPGPTMAEPPHRPRELFLAGLAAAYLAAFVSLYLQLPGLYGHDGILPVRRALRPGGRGLRELLGAEPTLLWLSPRAGLAAERGAELLCLLGAAAAIGALLSAALRGCLLLAAMHLAYLSLYQVGQVFLYFQWDSLLLEAGFLGVLVAPLRLFRWRSAAWRPHDGVTFWLVRWLLFRLMFASGVVKLTSRCPTWWGLTALTYHYETQCIPTPAAWFAHQLPVWFQKLSVVATYVIEIAVPPLFFAPIRRLRLFAFYCQVLLQVLIILTGNYNFFNALTIVLAFSLLDEEHVASWLGRSKKKHPSSWPPSLLAFLSTLLELAAYALLLYWSVQHFGLEIDWEKKVLESKVAFTYHEFTQWLRTVTLPLVGVGFLSLSWEILCALYRCISVRGCFWKLWALLQWGVFATAAVGVFAVSLVPFTYIDYESNGKLWPGIHHMFNAVERFQVVNSYGLFRRMTGVGGRPEVVLEGSYDKQTWTEIEFMYKPGNVSTAPPLVAPHQPRLDWQMWFAALGHHSSSPWFASFVYRLLQGKKDVIRLVQLDEAKYPFSAQPPTYIRAQLYKYWFTGSAETGEGATRWWRRQHVQEFFPTVSLGDPTLESLLAQHGLKDKAPPKRPATTFLPWLLESIRRLSLPLSGPVVLWSLYLGAASAALLRALGRRPRGGTPPARHKGPKRGDPVDRGGGEKNGQVRRKEEREERGEGRARGAADGEGPRGTKRKK
uniref:Lipase maturation factor n=1 Tax=Anas platyrhynchos platyrhynchos TaxID=8840 RepID=A0A493SW29_ANAPP